MEAGMIGDLSIELGNPYFFGRKSNMDRQTGVLPGNSPGMHYNALELDS
jgi:hypothetical protein